IQRRPGPHVRAAERRAGGQDGRLGVGHSLARPARRARARRRRRCAGRRGSHARRRRRGGGAGADRRARRRLTMVVGLVGSGNMATALARGWGEPVLCTDVFEERAQALAAATGGEAVASTAELAARADLVMLCHKPYQLDGVAQQIGGKAKAIASILAGVTIERLESAYPGAPVMRLMPNTAVEVRRGVICYAPGTQMGDPLATELLELLGR